MVFSGYPLGKELVYSKQHPLIQTKAGRTQLLFPEKVQGHKQIPIAFETEMWPLWSNRSRCPMELESQRLQPSLLAPSCRSWSSHWQRFLNQEGFTLEPKDGFVVVIVLPKIGGQGFKNRVQLIEKYE